MSLTTLVLRLLNIPRDLAIVLSHRAWQAGAGLVTLGFAVHFLSAEEQGWYYSFISVAALYTLFDLGLSVVLVQLAAHAFVTVQWSPHGGCHGPGQEYFHALLGRAARWYVLLGLVFVLGLVPGGLLFFGAREGASMHWVAPWISLCILTAASLVPLPFLSVVEGGGQVAAVYGVRLTQAVCGSVLCWLAFSANAGLWATIMVPAAAAGIPLAWLVTRRRELLRAAWCCPGAGFDWRREVWPLQWRLGLSQLCGYLLTQINIPILFRVQGAVEAGQLGLTLAIANTLGLLAQAWIVRRIPAMVQAVAARDWATLDRLFMRDLAASCIMFGAGAAAVLGLRLLIEGTALSERILPFWQLTGLLAVSFSSHIIGTLSNQLRSFRREPLTGMVVATTALTVPAVLWAAMHYSSAGMVAVLAGMALGVNLPLALLIWRRCNRIWRNIE